jgi:hypothetical protein
MKAVIRQATLDARENREHLAEKQKGEILHWKRSE